MIPYFSTIRNKDGKVTHIETTLSGKSLLNSPKLNKGNAFTYEERQALALTGTLPYSVETLEQQIARCYQQFKRQKTNMARHIFLNSLHDRNETLFFRLLSEHLAEMMPIVYTPTIGEAVETFSLENRKQRGFFISYPEIDNIDITLESRNNRYVDLIVVTDGEGILGIGDQGAGGIHICIGKLNLYTACAGIDPNRVLPIHLDVGTNNETLLNDPMYLGWRHKRITGKEYDDFIDKFVSCIRRKFPHVFLHWEDFGRDNARKNLNRYNNQMCTFNDDIQGTGAVTLAAVLAGVHASDMPLEEHRIAILGAGTAGVGIADQIYDALCQHGIDKQTAREKFYLIDRDGLLKTNTNNLLNFQKPYAKNSEKYQHITTLEDVIQHAKPTILIGCSTVTGAFTENIVKTMASYTKHPIIFPLSNPTRKAEAKPDDLLRWTNGNVLMATGSPFDPVNYNGKTIRVSQCNNAFIFPGLGLGIIATHAKRLTKGMLVAACHALSKMSPTRLDKSAPLLPDISNLTTASQNIALAVAKQARKDGVATIDPNMDLEKAIACQMWKPRYYPYKKVEKLSNEQT